MAAERNEGLDARDAIYKACLMRFRPIMMTTIAAILGALPLAFGFGNGAELRQPLGISIVGGLVVSQILTLYTTPVIYLYLDGWRNRRKPAWDRWYTRFMGDDARRAGASSGLKVRQVLGIRRAVADFGIAVLAVEAARRGIEIDRGTLDLVERFDIARAQIDDAHAGADDRNRACCCSSSDR